MQAMGASSFHSSVHSSVHSSAVYPPPPFEMPAPPAAATNASSNECFMLPLSLSFTLPNHYIAVSFKTVDPNGVDANTDDQMFIQISTRSGEKNWCQGEKRAKHRCRTAAIPLPLKTTRCVIAISATNATNPNATRRSLPPRGSRGRDPRMR